MRRIGGRSTVSATFLLSMALLGAAGSADRDAASRRADQAALSRFGPLVGDWRGTGQVRRGSNQGAWTETSSWAWKLEPASARLELTVAKGKYLRSATLIPPATAQEPLTLDAVLADGTHRLFRGPATLPAANDVPVVFQTNGPGDGPGRITLAIPNESRYLLTLYEHNGGNRLGEVGSTRVGASFAAGESGPKCIVTGGRGTMTVSYQGKSYPVCCSGCRDLFNADPAAVLAEAAARKPDSR